MNALSSTPPRTFIAQKGEVLDFETLDITGAVEGDRALVYHDERWTIATLTYQRVGGDYLVDWAIWTPGDYASAFAALLDLRLVSRHPASGAWVFDSSVVHLRPQMAEAA